ncbi:MAG: hypothetical protein IPL46_17525 [Saprospiraceae bacterium]|nr:hypothetical protein [Saprospiraceae bacterium]
MNIDWEKILLSSAFLLNVQIGLSQKFVREIIPIFKNITIEQGLTNNEIRQIVQDKTGFIWLATGSGINRYDGYSIQDFAPPVTDGNGLERLSWRPMNLIIDRFNRYFLGSDFAGLQMYDPHTNQLTHFTRSNSLLPHDGISSMATDWNGNIWIATNEGLCRFDPASKTIDRPVCPDHRINRLAIAVDSTVWIAPAAHGLFRFKEDTINACESLTMLTIRDIFIISSDSLLLATDSGAFLYTVRSDIIHPLFIDKPSHAFSSIYLDRYKNIWAGTYAHGLLYQNSSEKQSYQFRHETGNNQSIVSDKIACLFEDRQGNMWIGSYGDGVSIVSTNLHQVKVRYQKNRTSNGGNSISQIIKSSQGDVWYHNNRKLVQIVESEIEDRAYQITSPLNCQGDIRVISGFENGLLLATTCGLFKWSPSKPDLLIPALLNFPQLPQNQILSLNYQYPELYVGTTINGSSEGLWIVNPYKETIQQFRAEDKPGSIKGNQVTTALRGTNGDLWVVPGRI